MKSVNNFYLIIAILFFSNSSVSKTIADLDHSNFILTKHSSKAIQYRMKKASDRMLLL